MDNHLTQFQLVLNQFQYLTGQFIRLHISMMEESSNAKKLHIIQTVAGSSANLRVLFETFLREYIYTLTDTPPDAKNISARTRSNLLTVKKATPTIPPSRLPLIIDFLEDLKKISDLKSGK
ncbi:MAG: hypothetical protein ABI855_13605 [Bacteroidota bacterium]